MLNIDCLLKNTQYHQAIADYVKYIAWDHVAEGKDASFESIYKRLREDGIEVDVATAGRIYNESLPTESDANFTKASDVEERAGRQLKDTAEDYLLSGIKAGEKQIGELSPADYFVKKMADAFTAEHTVDATTKSLLRQIQDIYGETFTRLWSQEKENKGKVDTRTWDEKAKEGLEKMLLGHRNELTGEINSLRDLHEAVQQGLKDHLKRLREAGATEDQIEAFRQNFEDFQNTLYTVALTTKEGKDVVMGALKDAGFGRKLKNGKDAIDFEKLAGYIKDEKTLRDNVIDAMVAKGIEMPQAKIIADSLSNEFVKLNARILEKKVGLQQSKIDSWSAEAQKTTPKSLKEGIEKNMREWTTLIHTEGHEDDKLVFKRNEAKNIVSDMLRNSKEYGKEQLSGKKVIDWIKLGGDPPTKDKLQSMIESHLKDMGIEDWQYRLSAESIANDMHAVLSEQIKEQANKELERRQAAIDAPKYAAKSQIRQLAELNALGLFSGLHDKLVSQLTGINPKDSDSIDKLKNLATKWSNLQREVDYNPAYAQFAEKNFQKQISKILHENFRSRSKWVKAASIFRDIMRFENLAMISNAFNVVENSTSGFFAKLDSRLDAMPDVDKLFNSKEIFNATFKDVLWGGIDYGDTGDKFVRHADWQDSFNSIKAADFKNPRSAAKAIATAPIAFMRGMSQGMDSANKVVNRTRRMLSIIHMGLSQMENERIDKMVEEGNMTKAEAQEARDNIKDYVNGVLSEAFTGEKAAETKDRARYIIDKYGEAMGLKEGSKEKERAATRLAHDMIVANLKFDANVTEEFIDAALKSSMHAAGLGMGHVSNNMFSQMLHGSKTSQIAQEEQLIRKAAESNDPKKWESAAKRMIWNTMVSDGMFRMIGGGLNWGVIKMEGDLGGGIITGGGGHKLMRLLSGKAGQEDPSNKIDLDPKNMEESMKRILVKQGKLTRGMRGLSMSLLSAALFAAYGALRKRDDDEPKDESALKSAQTGASKSYVGKKLLNKIAPSGAMLAYQIENAKGTNWAELTAGSVATLANIFNINDQFTLAGQEKQIEDDFRTGKEKGANKGMALMGSMVANLLGSGAIARTADGYYQLVNWPISGEAPQPAFKNLIGENEGSSAILGLLQGSILDKSGILDPFTSVAAIPNIGDSQTKELQEKGYHSMKDIENKYKDDPQQTEKDLHLILGVGKKYKQSMHYLKTVYKLDVPQSEYEGYNKKTEPISPIIEGE